MPRPAGGELCRMVTEIYIHAIPLWLPREYLEEPGSQALSETEVVGDGW